MLFRSPGRILFNEEMPEGVPFTNDALNDKKIRKLIENVFKNKEHIDAAGPRSAHGGTRAVILFRRAAPALGPHGGPDRPSAVTAGGGGGSDDDLDDDLDDELD